MFPFLTGTDWFFRVYIQVHDSQTQQKCHLFGTAHSRVSKQTIPPLRLHCLYDSSLWQTITAFQFCMGIMILLSANRIFVQMCGKGAQREEGESIKIIFSLHTLPVWQFGVISQGIQLP